MYKVFIRSEKRVVTFNVLQDARHYARSHGGKVFSVYSGKLLYDYDFKI